MIDGSEKLNRQLAFELQNSHVCEKRSNKFKSVSSFQDDHRRVFCVTSLGGLYIEGLIMFRNFTVLFCIVVQLPIVIED